VSRFSLIREGNVRAKVPCLVECGCLLVGNGATAPLPHSKGEPLTMGEIIGIIIAGAIIGALARLFMKGDQNLGVLWTIILGALGALAGTFVASLFGVEETAGIDWIRWIISIILAIVFISAYLAIRGRSKTV
jgi:uncharacterized membrane protein YeaQ/YmgE (transglycosylase-associated protein family)